MKTQKQRLAGFMFVALAMVSTTLSMAAPRVANFGFFMYNILNNTTPPIQDWLGAVSIGSLVGTVVAPGIGTIVGAVTGL